MKKGPNVSVRFPEDFADLKEAFGNGAQKILDGLISYFRMAKAVNSRPIHDRSRTDLAPVACSRERPEDFMIGEHGELTPARPVDFSEPSYLIESAKRLCPHAS